MNFSRSSVIFSVSSIGNEMKNGILVSVVAVVVGGCSGGNNESSPECGGNSSCPRVQQVPATNIVGLWDRGGVQNSLVEVLYTFIGESGEFQVFDYQQDDFGSGVNCHTLDEGTIFRNSGSSNYTIEITTSESDSEGTSVSGATIFFLDGNLEVKWDNGAVETWLPVTDITKNDLVLCQ